MSDVAFYIMNSKGWFVLSQFIEKFGHEKIAYVVSEQDLNMKNDFFHDIEKISLENKIPFYKRTDFDSDLEKNFNGYKFAIGWRWLIGSQENLIVFHDSLLPKYRGFAPLVNSLINKELRGGVTALFADVKYDVGDIICQKSVEFSYPLKIETAISKIQPLYFDLISEIYNFIQIGESLKASVQDHSKATYSLWLDQEDYYINWKWSAEKIKRFVDAVGFPYDGAKAILNGEIVKLIDVEVLEDVEIEHRERHIGKVIFFDSNPIIVCASGIIKLVEILDLSGQSLKINFRSRFK